MSWLSNYFSREKEIARLRNENEGLHRELRDANRCLDVVNTNLLIVAEIIHDTVDGDDEGNIVEWSEDREFSGND